MVSRSESNILRWLEEESSDDEDQIASDSDEEFRNEDCLLESSHSTDTEQEESDTGQNLESDQSVSLTRIASNSDSEDDVPLISLRNDYYTSKNGTKWKKHPYPITRTRIQNIRKQSTGPIGAAKNASSELECFELYFDQSVIEIITNNTNIYIEQVRSKFTRERDAKATDTMEIRALIGILFVIGVQKSGRRNVKDLWNTTRGIGTELIYLAMSLSRFRFLLRAVRFDDVRDRERRKLHDKLAPIRDIFEKIVSNCKQHFVPSDCVTLDEQLVAFRGRCPFRQYIPNKPAKYGIKIFLLTDTQVPYTYNMEIYAGAQPPGPYQQSNKVVDIVERMLTPLHGSSCNVTMDNWFTNIPQCLELLEKKITVVGTVKKNKPQVPEEFKITRNRSDNSSIFGFQKQGTLVSYKPKPKKVVLMYSTMHYDGKIDSQTVEKCKPEIITFYNNTKYGVDIVDKMCGTYDVSRNSRRWPLTIFFNIMNISAVNGYVVHTINKQYNNKARKDYLYEVGFGLLAPCISRRISTESIPKSLRMKGKMLLGQNDTPELHPYPAQPSNTGRVGKCSFCGRARNKSTRKQCHTCNKWICPQHQSLQCPSCSRSDEIQLEEMSE